METATQRPRITEAQAEHIIDRMVWKRLATDSAYRNAEDAEAQSQREDEITDNVVAYINAKYDIRR